MSIPLDRLYNFIESVAEQVFNDRVIIYRFFPHGEKNIDDLTQLSPCTMFERRKSPEIICNDQEPLFFDYYHQDIPFYNNLRRRSRTVWDNVLLLHSELNSDEVTRYENHGFTPVYYWAHGLIASDWFRYAKYITQKKENQRKKFLIYNRAWSGSREYRLKFVDHLIDKNLVESCKTTCNVIEPITNIHYSDHRFINPAFAPHNVLDDYFQPTVADSSASADFELADYQQTDIEIVLETLFDDNRIQLTEKILRPIAVGQPFIIASTPFSLDYIRKYGFKTFADVWDESYDEITDHSDRLIAIANLMAQIDTWDEKTMATKMSEARKITRYNKRHFFSEEFTNIILDELRDNLKVALDQMCADNTGTKWLEVLSDAQDPNGDPFNREHYSESGLLKYLNVGEISELNRIARQFSRASVE
jgi:hypothetical protein